MLKLSRNADSTAKFKLKFLKMFLRKRNQVFETNSSSTHSISIVKDIGNNEEAYFLNRVENGVYEIELGSYGWEEETYYGYDEKISYLATMLYSCGCNGYYDNEEELENGFKKIILESDLGILLKELGVSDIKIKSRVCSYDRYSYDSGHRTVVGRHYYYDASVDHQSHDSMKGLVKSAGADSLYTLVFDDSYVVITGNDNC